MIVIWYGVDFIENLFAWGATSRPVSTKHISIGGAVLYEAWCNRAGHLCGITGNTSVPAAYHLPGLKASGTGGWALNKNEYINYVKTIKTDMFDNISSLISAAGKWLYPNKFFQKLLFAFVHST